LGYGQSIHQIKKPERIAQIFGLYNETANGVKQQNENKKQKNIEEKSIEVTATYLRTTIHNRIQQCVYDELVRSFGIENVKMEKDKVDIVLHQNKKTVLIEVKPYNSARQCIVEGLGQLLNYYERSSYDKQNLELLIIGNEEPSNDDTQFIKFIKSTLHIPFEYKSWKEVHA
jgi:predicted AAA+ superfamily ATPase